MAKSFPAWKVLPHGPIEKLSENLWRVKGALPGMSLERVMTIVRLEDGRLAIFSAIALRDDEMRELEAWGTPAFLIMPNGWHRLDAVGYVKRYPQLQVFAPKGSRKRVEDVVPVAGTFSDFPSTPTLSLSALPGIRDLEGVMQVRSADGVTVVLGDAVMNMDNRHDAVGYLLTRVLGSAPGPRVSRLIRWRMADNRKALRAELERLAQTAGLVRVIVAHDKVASGPDAAATLRAAASYL